MVWMRASAVCLAAAMAVGTGGGCGQKKVSDRDLVFVDVNEAHILSQGERRFLGLGEKTAVWLDPRNEAAFKAGHIPGALHIPLEEIKAGDRRLTPYDVLIVYGDDYRSPIAEAACKKLLAANYADVRTLRGGLRAWTTQGNTLETGPGGQGAEARAGRIP